MEKLQSDKVVILAAAHALPCERRPTVKRDDLPDKYRHGDFMITARNSRDDPAVAHCPICDFRSTVFAVSRRNAFQIAVENVRSHLASHHEISA